MHSRALPTRLITSNLSASQSPLCPSVSKTPYMAQPCYHTRHIPHKKVCVKNQSHTGTARDRMTTPTSKYLPQLTADLSASQSPL